MKEPSLPPVLDQLLRSCASITRTALSCPTLCTSHYHRNDIADQNSHSVESAYRDEVEVAKWLDSQIADYRSAITRQNMLRNGSSSPEQNPRFLQNQDDQSARDRARGTYDGDSSVHSLATTRSLATSSVCTQRNEWIRKEREIRRLKDELFDETVRAQQEKLLISRIRMSAAAIYTSFPDAAPLATRCAEKGKMDRSNADMDSTTTNTEIERYEQCLRREGLRSRDNAVLSALQKMRRVDELRAELNKASDECRIWQERNRALWGTLVSDSKNASLVGAIAHATEHNSNNIELATRLTNENKVLKRALMDIITGSGIDWFSDRRLAITMMRLEE